MSTVFCVEDDANIRELIEYTLASAGFEARGFECGADFFGALKNAKPDIILLDIMLPDTDGLEILKKVRAEYTSREIPVIMLTAKSERIDKIRGLDLGADDYISKPFDILELIARVKAVLRRTGEVADSGMYSYGNLTLNHKKRQVFVNGSEVQLTYKEYGILHMLLKADGNVVTRESIIANIWNSDFEGESRTLDVHIRSLRQKLGDAGRYIDTVRNVGYKVG